jgi:hypothetical protein
MLTDLQLNHYKTFGFSIMRDVFTPAEIEILRDEFETELDYVYRDQPFAGETRYWTMMLGQRTPFFAGLLEDERFCGVAEQLYGDDVIGIGTDANRYVGDTKWHPDHGANPDEDCFGVKFALYLDPVDATTGALRIVPGSHNRPYHEQLRGSWETLDLEVTEVPSYVCDSQPGDAVAFDMRCWHGSHGGASGRRMVTCVYYNNPQGEAQEAATCKRGEASRDTPAQFNRPDGSMYPTEYLANPAGSSKRQRWLERMAQFGYFDLPV